MNILPTALGILVGRGIKKMEFLPFYCHGFIRYLCRKYSHLKEGGKLSCKTSHK